FRPRICSEASETEATSTCRKPSRITSPFVAVDGTGASCAEALGPDQNKAATAVATMLITAAARKYFLARGVEFIRGSRGKYAVHCITNLKSIERTDFPLLRELLPRV